LNTPEDQNSIVKRIVDGSVTIDAIEEFESILNLFPADPALHRAYGDLLAEKQNLQQAADSYGRAARLFANQGDAVQAIVAKILEWSINKPTHEEGREFFAALRDSRSPESPLQNFFAKLSYPELVSVMLRLVRVRLQANVMVKRFGEIGTEIFFVVSGKLLETTYHDDEQEEGRYRKTTTSLGSNDIFGDILPFTEKKASGSDIETLTRVELVKIAKPVLANLCKKFPNIEILLGGLYRAPASATKGRTWRTVRKTERHELPIKVGVKIFRDENQNPLMLEGFTKDISLGGACIDLGAKYWASPSADLKGRNVRVQIGLPNAKKDLSILGSIAWCKELQDGDKPSLALGIQFASMTDTDRELLQVHCLGSHGEQNLIWSMWDALVKK
jgi:CRP-like cAMP-binding protein